MSAYPPTAMHGPVQSGATITPPASVGALRPPAGAMRSMPASAGHQASMASGPGAAGMARSMPPMTRVPPTGLPASQQFGPGPSLAGGGFPGGVAGPSGPQLPPLQLGSLGSQYPDPYSGRQPDYGGSTYHSDPRLSVQSQQRASLQSMQGRPTFPSMPEGMLPPTAGVGNPFQTLPPQERASVGGASAGASPVRPALGKELTIRILRLLDMPIEQTLFGKEKKYSVRICSERDKELAKTGTIEGIADEVVKEGDTETLTLTEEEGLIRLRTESRLLHVFVEHVGGIGGVSQPIGRCQIHRQDPRSSQVWPYLLSDEEGSPANCGVELKVEEGVPPVTGLPEVLPSGQIVPPFDPASPGPSAVGAFVPPPGPPRGPLQEQIQDASHGVSAFLEIDKVTDLPIPQNHKLTKVLVIILNKDGSKELRRVGPFPAQVQRYLVAADCRNSRVYLEAPLHVGGVDGDGAMYFKISVGYVKDVDSNEVELVGTSDPIKVMWQHKEKYYTEIMFHGAQQVLGGVHLAHHLITDLEVTAAEAARRTRTPREVALQAGFQLAERHRLSGRTGNFPPGTAEEAIEQAALNAEAQNRAMLQRCNMADPGPDDKNPHVRTVNGYREWDSLDSLFSTMGPSPLAASEEVGPHVVRSFHEESSVMKAISKDLPPVLSKADALMNQELVQMMYDGDPLKIQSNLRPVICKDPVEIARTRDMSWCPDPPLYANLKNISEEDKETLRLACFHPSQSAKLGFHDVNPNYRVQEDIWGALEGYKLAKSPYVGAPQLRQSRVKDDCLMA